MEEHYFFPEILLRGDGYYRPLCPVEDEFLAGEIVNRWFHREQSRRLKDLHEREMMESEPELAELLFRRKQMLCRLGRGGQWSLWLRQQKIARSTADRLVAQYAESHGLADELFHRERAEPLEGDICLAANRVFKRLKRSLGTQQSRMTFIRCLADLLGLGVDFSENGSVVLSLSPPPNDDDLSKSVPNVFGLSADGAVIPVDYELNEKKDNSPQ